MTMTMTTNNINNNNKISTGQHIKYIAHEPFTSLPSQTSSSLEQGLPSISTSAPYSERAGCQKPQYPPSIPSWPSYPSPVVCSQDGSSTSPHSGTSSPSVSSSTPSD